MRFTLIDRILNIEPGAKLTAVKSLSLAEEYLADHFPGFPVMPGVLMLEAMTQASAWLVRATEDFAHSMVVLKEARNVKYANFVEPGQTLTVTVELLSQDGRETKFKAQGQVAGATTVSARLTLERYNLADDDFSRAAADQVIRLKLRELWALLYRSPPAAVPSPAQSSASLEHETGGTAICESILGDGTYAKQAGHLRQDQNRPGRGTRG